MGLSLDLVIELIAASHLLLYGAYLLMNKTKRNYGIVILGVFIFIMGLHFSMLVAENLNWIYIKSRLFYKISLLSYGPLIYLFNKKYLSNEDKLVELSDIKHLIILIIPVIYTALNHAEFLENYPILGTRYITFTKIIIYPINIFYLILSFRLLSYFKKNSNETNQVKIATFVNWCYLLMISIWIMLIIGTELNNIEPVFFKIAFLVVLMVLIDGLIILSLKYPDTITQSTYLRNRVNSWKSEKYSSSQMDPSYARKLAEDLNEFIIAKKNFQDSAITLSKVSEQLGYPVKDISQLINENHSVGFREYVNQFRIKEAGKQLLNDPDLRVNEVMYDVGFNSKSIFHKYFKQAYGVTPNQFKKSEKSQTMIGNTNINDSL